MKEDPDIEVARSIMGYDPATGVFRWKVKANQGIGIGDVAGGDNGIGYVELRLAGVRVLAHRAAWAFTHGAWPERFIDHINGNRKDNRIANLRQADRALNGLNLHTPPRSACGYRGVSYDKRRGRFTAYLANKWLGSFHTAEAASAVYEAAKAEHIRSITQ